MVTLPFNGGRVRFRDGDTRYPDGRHAWRCSACGRVGPWTATHGGYWSYKDEDDGLFADHGRGYPVWCSEKCEVAVVASGATGPLAPPVVKRKRP